MATCDPNANLAEQRQLVAHIIEQMDARDVDITPADALQLAELVEALDEWITKGGFLPAAWSR